MHLTALDQLAAGGAAAVAGVVNALAGGGTLISFPTLVGLGVPAVPANVTNTVSLVPGYLTGAYAQRRDLEGQIASARVLAAVAAVGGLAGSILLVVIPGHAFRVAIPYLILVSCGLLAFGRRLGPDPRHISQQHPLALTVSIFVGAVYGGFFGAGLGIMFLALLAIFSNDSLTKLNALKQALSFICNIVAAAFFVFSGRTVWVLVPVMAVGAMAGGAAGGRLVQVIDGDRLRQVVVVTGIGIAVYFFVA